MLFRVLLAAGLASAAAAQTPAPTELPALNVVGRPVPGENKIVGSYGQPEWSARRPFPGVSVYVQPEHQAELEFGYADALSPTGAHQREWTQEIELGLGHRFQAALENDYADFRDDSSHRHDWHEVGLRAALRYALADWGQCPLNPALGLGWRANSGAADAALYELALGDELAPRWHWGANATYERQNGSARHREFLAAGALTYSVTNETLNVGVQAEWRRAYEAGDAPSLARRSGLGPCLQYRPSDRLHLDLVGLWGTEHGHAVHGVRLSVGFEFGEGSDDHDDDERRPGGRFGR
ncbi:transporter [Oleiharenicola sp. Vm1]|uniref:transporter n=1 Tax=Oleiharenicola sp. Vm1 TaxID=3398393 RepID=UPI0039F5B636